MALDWLGAKQSELTCVCHFSPPPPLQTGGTCADGSVCAVDGSTCTPSDDVYKEPFIDCTNVACGPVPDGTGNAYICPSTCAEDEVCKDNLCVKRESFVSDALVAAGTLHSPGVCSPAG